MQNAVRVRTRPRVVLFDTFYLSPFKTAACSCRSLPSQDPEWCSGLTRSLVHIAGTIACWGFLFFFLAPFGGVLSGHNINSTAVWWRCLLHATAHPNYRFCRMCTFASLCLYIIRFVVIVAAVICLAVLFRIPMRLRLVFFLLSWLASVV